MNDKELLERVTELEEDLKHNNEMLRSCEDLVTTYKRSIEKTWPEFHQLLEEAKYRKLIK